MRRGTWQRDLVFLFCGLGLAVLGGIRCKTTASSTSPSTAYEPKCATYYTAQDCALHTQCTLDATGRCTFIGSCAVLGPDQPNCQRYADCYYDPNSLYCTNASSMVGGGNVNCQQYNAMPAQCASYATYGCQYNQTTSQCMLSGSSYINCSQYTVSTCPAGCSAVGGLCQSTTTSTSYVNCALYNNNAAQCQYYPTSCRWLASGIGGTQGTCQNLSTTSSTCYTSYDQSSCAQRSGMCMWNGTSCISSTTTSTCQAATSFFSCLVKSGCTWSSSMCIPKT